MDYRPEIDGLRAIAILSVILFHAGFETFAGGFVGVDVFFVISGYLITAIILAELEQGKFSIVDFYERRARRILPALLLVLFVSIPFAWCWLFPSDMQDYFQSLVAVSLFTSNILFWRESNYFTTSADLKPLLHTWSLAVEEQYYVLLPLVLMLMWRFDKRWIGYGVAIVFVVSLSVAQWGVTARPAAAFFLLPSRAWELVIGVVTALYLSKVNRIWFDRRIAEVGGCLGLVLILCAVCLYSRNTPFPGLYALVPTIGAALIILSATQQTTIGQFLGNKVLVGIGLMSYSTYLWHWPLFVFARHGSLHEPNRLVFAMLSVVAFALAYLSWRFVETPLRNSLVYKRKYVFTGTAVALVFIGMIGLSGSFMEGIYEGQARLNKMRLLESRFVYNHGLSSDCTADFTDSVNCVTSDRPEVLVWGDSYAMHLVPGLLASNQDLKITQKTVSVCGPWLDIAPINATHGHLWAEKCMRINDQVFEYLEKMSSIKYVVMSSSFRQYVEDDARVLTRSGDIVPGGDVVYGAMAATLARIKRLGRIPVVFSPTPQNGENVGRCLMKATIFERDHAICDIKLSDSYAWQSPIYELLRRMEKENHVIWLNDGLCIADVCKASFEGVFLYRDSGHLSREGSAYLGKRMELHKRLEALPRSSAL